MKNSAVPYWLSLLIVLSAAYGSWHWWKSSHSAESAAGPHASGASYLIGEIEHPVGEPIENFTLTDQNGRPFDTAKLKGQVWIASFFYSSCPAICKKLNNELSVLQHDADLKDLKFVSITVDPMKDTPEELAGYAKMFDANAERWVFLTGDMVEIARIGNQEFKVPTLTSTHSDRVIIVDRQGRLRGMFNATDDAQMARLKRWLQKLLQEEPVLTTETAAAGRDS